MDMLINRLYRTRLQFGYENESGSEQSSSKGSQTQYAYAGNDAAEISPLAIVFYTSAQNSEGQFKDLSDQFAKSPFAQNLDDYADQARKLANQQYKQNTSTGEKQNQGQEFVVETERKNQILSDTLYQNSQNMDVSFHQRLQVKIAYNQMGVPDAAFQQQMINILA
jgi:hypothetical protein